MTGDKRLNFDDVDFKTSNSECLFQLKQIVNNFNRCKSN